RSDPGPEPKRRPAQGVRYTLSQANHGNRLPGFPAAAEKKRLRERGIAVDGPGYFDIRDPAKGHRGPEGCGGRSQEGPASRDSLSWRTTARVYRARDRELPDHPVGG